MSFDTIFGVANHVVLPSTAIIFPQADLGWIESSSLEVKSPGIFYGPGSPSFSNRLSQKILKYPYLYRAWPQECRTQSSALTFGYFQWHSFSCCSSCEPFIRSKVTVSRQNEGDSERNEGSSSFLGSSRHARELPEAKYESRNQKGRVKSFLQNAMIEVRDKKCFLPLKSWFKMFSYLISPNFSRCVRQRRHMIIA